MAEERFAEENSAVLGPFVDKFLTMMGVARDAFNRHSRASLQELQNLKISATPNIETTSIQLRSLMARKPEAERSVLLRLLSILNHMEIIDENIGGLASPIEKKVKDGVLFSDKAVIQTNYLFDQHAGIIRSVLDVIKTDNDFLKKFVFEEGRKLIQASQDFATEHEDRMIEGLCLPQAAPIFLAILDKMRSIGQHEVGIATLLTKKP
jgi:Na+/phosphate symporter